jgi:hypothetical protein
MFDLANETSYAAGRTLICDQDGRDVWIVAAKGTFLIKPDGTTVVADEQEEVLPFPKHFGDPQTTSLKYECDLDYTKPTTDVLLHGHAHAPGGKPATEVDVTMKVGPITKTLHVSGDRSWKQGTLGLRLTDPEPFEKMPITYERAFGGTDLRSDDPGKRGWEPRNPIGTGYTANGSPFEGQKMPNIGEPSSAVAMLTRRPKAVGFGPVARHWTPRAQLAGTYDAKWEKSRFPLLPTDFNERFFQCAPEDQQAPRYLLGNEEVELRNLTPDGLLKFRLPRVAVRFETTLAGEDIEQRGKLHTVILEPDVPRVIMVWQTCVPCHGKRLKLAGSVVFEKPYIN